MKSWHSPSSSGTAGQVRSGGALSSSISGLMWFHMPCASANCLRLSIHVGQDLESLSIVAERATAIAKEEM